RSRRSRARAFAALRARRSRGRRRGLRGCHRPPARGLLPRGRRGEAGAGAPGRGPARSLRESARRGPPTIPERAARRRRRETMPLTKYSVLAAALVAIVLGSPAYAASGCAERPRVLVHVEGARPALAQRTLALVTAELTAHRARCEGSSDE